MCKDFCAVCGYDYINKTASFPVKCFLLFYRNIVVSACEGNPVRSCNIICLWRAETLDTGDVRPALGPQWPCTSPLPNTTLKKGPRPETLTIPLSTGGTMCVPSIFCSHFRILITSLIFIYWRVCKVTNIEEILQFLMVFIILNT